MFQMVSACCTSNSINIVAAHDRLDAVRHKLRDFDRHIGTKNTAFKVLYIRVGNCLTVYYSLMWKILKPRKSLSVNSTNMLLNRSRSLTIHLLNLSSTTVSPESSVKHHGLTITLYTSDGWLCFHYCKCTWPVRGRSTPTSTTVLCWREWLKKWCHTLNRNWTFW